MKICIIAEGSYPYITGGVSSWIHTLIRSMLQHEFIIYAIGAEQRYRGSYKYELPANVERVEEVFLDSFHLEENRWGRTYKTGEQERAALQSLIAGDNETDWDQLFRTLRDEKWRTSTEFLMSRDYFDLLSELCRVRFEQLPFTEMFWTVRSMLLPLVQLIRRPLPEADLYHAVSTGYAGVIASLGKHLYQKPMLLTEHGIYSREREEEIIKADWVKGYFKDLWIRYFYGLSRCAYHYADQVVTLFERNREIEVELGCPESKISIVPNGIKVEEYLDLPSKPEEDKMIQIGAIVRVVPIKDIKTMLYSFAAVKREVPNATFTIMGPHDEDQEYYRECIDLVRILELEDVAFTGSVDVKQYLGRMDIIVLTSISEGQPLAVLEAMAAGKPVVATDVGNCREMLYGSEADRAYGRAGTVVPVLDDQEIAKAIIALCDSKTDRQVMGMNGRRRVMNAYTHELFIDRYESLYMSLGLALRR
ncbi:GT4 family glycosyltransferase PelF [Brevibacillus humidisoli]|uniref:GT4 family glycosyltransferase PelF n=1 Tax=Brevibacillus humidisoli TaxID=2895522 RepID=UPI001E360585|nr:GT4 family glycosyltransferase PelF [Brevibacillus humidisoli]UFJ41049.1 GT4 family glycosyltransferase PelF [Brevibacillus humidisoli]